MAPTSPDIGIVRTQAQTTRRAIPHRTAETRWTAPTPTMAPVIVCVVDTGTPSFAEVNREIAAAASAQAPPYGRSFVNFIPIVFTIRQPPAIVPRAIARWQTSTIQNGNCTLPVSNAAWSAFQIVA